jgi:hypothetical protein
MGLATLLAWRIKMPQITMPTIEMDNSNSLQGFDNIDINIQQQQSQENKGVNIITIISHLRHSYSSTLAQVLKKYLCTSI